jgi:two-component system, NtrC family, nitrogen regulation sensor histidine kinase NtrY
MILVKKVKQKLLLFFILACIFILAGFLTNNYLEKKSQDYVSQVKNTQKILRIKENHLTEILNRTLSEIENGGIEALFNKSELPDFQSEGYTVLCYKNDTLRFWSDNNVQIGTLYDRTGLDSAFIQIGNGWYYVKRIIENDIKLVGFILVKNDYRYTNDYLKSYFQSDFNLPQDAKIGTKSNGNDIFTEEGKYIFSIEFKNNTTLSEQNYVLIFVLYLIGLFLLIGFIFIVHKSISQYYKSNLLFFLGFTLDIIIIRLLTFNFRIPVELYKSPLFSPMYFASSELLPSFGDLLINAILFLVLAWVFYKHFKVASKLYRKINSYLRLCISCIGVIIIAFLYKYVLQVIQSIVIDSTIPYTLNNVFNLETYSLVGFLIIAMIVLGFVLIAKRILDTLFNLTERATGFIFSAVFAMIVILIMSLLRFKIEWFASVSFSVFLVGVWLFRKQVGKSNIFSRIIFILIFFSLVCTHILHNSNNYKETEKRKSLAQKLSNSQDPIAEFLFDGIEEKIMSDKLLKEKILKYKGDEFGISSYISKNYFTGYWDKYRIQITLCRQNDSLFIKPAMINQNCYEYFDDLIQEFGKATTTSNLFMLNYGTGGNSYLSRLSFPVDSANTVNVYIEMYSKFIPKGLGYPELLIDKKIFLNTDLSSYSYARYRNKELVDAYGKYYYSILQDPNDTVVGDIGFFNRNGYDHLYYKIDDTSSLVISKKQSSLLEIIAPFSLLFLFFAIFLLLLFLIVTFPFRFNDIRLNFKNRLQVSMISIIIISFILIGISMYYYIRNLNENKNIDALSEKALSILIETQSKLAEYDSLTPELENYMSNSLVKFSNVFFTDINLFNLNGDLIASSRPQIFNEGLVSYKINPLAYNELVYKNKTIFIHKEKIGSLEFYSAYLPFYNYQNKLIAYLNLPYFAKENELKQELSTFMMTFINIYVFLIAMAIIIALFIAGRMTRPLKEIREKIGQVKLGGKNEKITWVREDDEIGSLVSEYNRMIDELSLSAELLAKSERESAWREMAKQVAHEIKNPLTPMKLSVQYLEKAWREKAPDWEQKFGRFTFTLIEQIESLSAIATAFSDFAKMPRSEMEKVYLPEVLNTSIATFTGSKTNIQYELLQEKELFILADKKQIIRVFNNLITNAIQAIGNQKNGLIVIKANREDNKVIISVKDNGPGIPEDQKSKIFIPNFSTKSEGMGLGLAMVKSIIEGHGGVIWFQSHEGEGANFIFELPAFNEKEV